ncbi:Hypothetical protein GbCGDNIH1I4_1630 [Granulibacter bethesdensis]|nr:Hypothetical protein GbCGDNIH1I4_1630 [Granulibacter bethesdensis]
MRSISAHAEEPPGVGVECARRRVYLRARGGTPGLFLLEKRGWGLSPRTRRNRSVSLVVSRATGSISAHAEEPGWRGRSAGRAEVYLRARGGTGLTMDASIAAHGLSPRTRRNRMMHPAHPAISGSISAHAEEPIFSLGSAARIAVYLRARGGTYDLCRAMVTAQGLSPRTRRNHEWIQAGVHHRGSISAHAEEPLSSERQGSSARVYLRARGGTAHHCLGCPVCQGLSPRTRRNRLGPRLFYSSIRSISAHAEEPFGQFRRVGRTQVYLRARGGTWNGAYVSELSSGLSPRTRRNRVSV